MGFDNSITSMHQKRQNYCFEERISSIHNALQEILIAFHLVYHMRAFLGLYAILEAFFRKWLSRVLLATLTHAHKNPKHTLVSSP